ncbi:MAG: serine/threonine-protein kinase, partial [Polyangiaceae bacterium]
MGLVYAARHLRLGERVAVKLLLPQIASRPDARVRFEREGRAAARLKSEHIARVHDAGSLPSGALYLVLELLRGHDLRTEIAERGPLPVEVATAYLAQACEGVAEAHSIGVIHRDLKPANLFLAERPDGSRIVKILDFGVSRLLPIAEDATAPAHLTASESAVGTPHYMAPEQMRAARDASPASDVYALGATLYGLLVGESPFQGETMVAVYDRIMAGPPSARARRPDVPEALDAVIAR